MKTSEIYTLKEKLNKLETEYYHLHDWFGRYDRLIWTLRSLVFTIYAAIIIYAFDSLKTATTNHFRALVLFALFFLFMETYWLWRYWKKKTLRYKDIQRIVNQTLKNECLEIPLLDLDHNVSEKQDELSAGGWKSIVKKITEPFMFYAGLVIISVILFYGT